jgi:hypothetical protein
VEVARPLKLSFKIEPWSSLGVTKDDGSIERIPNCRLEPCVKYWLWRFLDAVFNEAVDGYFETNICS